MSIGKKNSKRELVEKVMMASRDSGTRAILFQQTVGHALGLSATDMKCLDLIYRAGPASPTELVKLTGLTSGAVTTLIDRLEETGMIERKLDSKDRRRTVLIPTEKSARTIPGLYKSLGASAAEYLSKVPEKELHFLEKYFAEMGEIFRRETDKLRQATRKK
jgi:DNA-binding MarR family transcriptional regulator